MMMMMVVMMMMVMVMRWMGLKAMIYSRIAPYQNSNQEQPLLPDAPIDLDHRRHRCHHHHHDHYHFDNLITLVLIIILIVISFPLRMYVCMYECHKKVTQDLGQGPS